jgi:hypothetical protein
MPEAPVPVSEQKNVTVTSSLFQPYPFAAGKADPEIDGLVESRFTVVETDATFPALSWIVWEKTYIPSVVALSVPGHASARPLVASEQEYDTSTGLLLNPFVFAAALGVAVNEGAVASRLIDTDWLEVPPALVAEHVSVVPDVSLEIVVEPQPVVEVTVDCASVTLHETVTSLVYQLLLPSVPLTFGVITGGVESVGTTTVTE